MKKKELHFKPLKNWMNDPNGLIYLDGLYHVYYQYFPYAPQWGTMHWGHATTKDFYEWEYHDIALFPSITADKNGCFSGSALKMKDEVFYYYTGVDYDKNINANNIHVPINNKFISSQLMISSKDGFVFDNFNDKKIIVPPILDSKIGDVTHTRDPKVWEHNGEYYMVLGTKKIENGRFVGGVLLYKSFNAIDFDLIGTAYNKNIGDMWECPDIFSIGDASFLVMSPENLYNFDNCYTNNSIVVKIDLDYGSGVISIDEDYKLQDIGMDAYASQTFIDEFEERVMLSWLRMPNTGKNNTIGKMTMPRTLRVENGELCYSVHKNILDKFSLVSKLEELVPKRIITTMNNNDIIDVHGYKIIFKDNYLTFSRKDCFNVYKNVSVENSILMDSDSVDIDIFFDFEVIETFVNGGMAVCTHIIEKYNNNIFIPNEYVVKKMEEK